MAGARGGVPHPRHTIGPRASYRAPVACSTPASGNPVDIRRYGRAVELRQSDKLAHVAYDVRGPVLDEAMRLEAEGHRILRLNLGNPAPFGFEAPDEIVADMARQL